DIIESAGAGFRCQIHLESCSRQHFVRMQGLHEEYACLVAAGIDGAIETRNCDKGLTGKFIRHNFFRSFLFFAIRIGDTEYDVPIADVLLMLIHLCVLRTISTCSHLNCFDGPYKVGFLLSPCFWPSTLRAGLTPQPADRP